MSGVLVFVNQNQQYCFRIEYRAPNGIKCTQHATLHPLTVQTTSNDLMAPPFLQVPEFVSEGTLPRRIRQKHQTGRNDSASSGFHSPTKIPNQSSTKPLSCNNPAACNPEQEGIYSLVQTTPHPRSRTNLLTFNNVSVYIYIYIIYIYYVILYIHIKLWLRLYSEGL